MKATIRFIKDYRFPNSNRYRKDKEVENVTIEDGLALFYGCCSQKYYVPKEYFEIIKTN